ncbi:3-phosphoinositide-dependent protein kinase-1 [Tripterygium wilfordii]|uniref:3-phosphoinositide-dependent protein kinase-1 n=1 Tax=Tripterygium wilfordii TaxID=458696 RepID=A0A7J7DA19_TRIWF|nr:protein APEM9-like [Tripterygium wilfordii]KAF5742926.1 3-phosphoinositide-dependent protein kinase-1 [Tripterygium wilfordii]
MCSVSELASSIWEEIERSESYLVCCMYEKAASLASSVLKQIRNRDGIEVEFDYDVQEMEESAGMVLVQSLDQLGRASEILSELKRLFVSVADIPVQVLVTGACFQIAEGSSIEVREFLEDFLSEWSYEGGEYYFLVGVVADISSRNKRDGQFVLAVNSYLEVVEIYAMTLIGTVLKNIDLAISWVEKASLPEDRRQELLRRLHSMYSVRTASESQTSSSLLPADIGHIRSPLKEANSLNGSQEALKSNLLFNRENNKKQTLSTLSKRVEPCFWWFRNITLKFGNVRLVVSNGKIMIGCLIFLVFYIFRRKQVTLKRIVTMQASSLKKALVDLWHLAFSYQVNPLAAVQPLPPATRGNN